MVDDRSGDDAAAFGVALPAQEPEEPELFEVWEENWPAVELFLRVQTQWRVTQWRVGMNGPVGLDYGAVQWVISLYAVQDPRAALEDLQIMEAAVLAAVSKRAS